MTNYITSESFRCLLGPQSKNVTIHNNLFTWEVGKKKHFCVQDDLTQTNISILKDFIKDSQSNFHYISENNLSILKENFSTEKAKHTSVVLDIQDLSFKGVKNSGIRHSLNCCKKQNFSIEKEYRNIQDVKNLINEWSSNYTDKYFRDNSGKNFHFYKNNFHKDLINIFIYHEDSLIAFGTLSQPINNLSSYVVGKALFKRFRGLSEFADVELYKMAKQTSFVNMGAATKGLLDYKKKFTHTLQTHFDGSIK